MDGDIALKALGQGDLLRAYELASALLAKHGENPRQRYHQILALARMGETDQAQALYDLHLAPQASGDIDALAMAARLLKDRAWLADGPEHRALLRAASAAYEEIYEMSGNSFPAINAASLAYLSGDRPRADALAKAAMACVEDAGPGDYFAAATVAEAHIILGNPEAARDWIAIAVTLPGSDLGARSSTTRQFTRLLAGCDAGVAIIDVLRPPPVLHYCGHMFFADGKLEDDLRRQIDSSLDCLGSSIAYGALSCGADILIAEAMLARGGELNIVLPFALDDYVRLSVSVGGPEWVPRFEKCLAAANDVEFASPTPVMQQDQQLAYASMLSMGYARLRAQHLLTSSRQLVVWDGSATTAHAGTSADVARWRKFGGMTEAIPFDRTRHRAPQATSLASAPVAEQKIRAMIFADFAKFSSMSEGELPAFWQSTLGQTAKVINRYDHAICSRNTWGDGLFLVASDAVSAAKVALDLQSEVSDHGVAAPGLEKARLRIGIHLGAVFEAIDPVTGNTTFYGNAVNMTARIEPVATTGEVYVTRQFASILKIENPDEFTLSYVGRIALAKNFGEATMYRLSAALPCESGPSMAK